MDINFETIKALMKENKYIATDEIVWNVIKSIKKMEKKEQKGQDIYSICLEGPPGAGKSFYAKTYAKVLGKVLNEEVEFLEYSCDSTTGKADLYEEIRVAAAITNNPNEVIISGMLVEAIDAVNTGKKVILVLDEFEKSRRETDSFMYQFLQDGKIKTTQRGIVEIKPEYKRNLQVILCKNDERELSDPLIRRNHIIRLEIMTPSNFVETINMNLFEYDEDIRNIVSLLYEKMYRSKDDFAKFPSCSEGMLAIQDACDLYELGAPVEVIYADILSNLLKHPDDIETFKILISKDKQLSNFTKILKNNKKLETNATVKDEIYKSFFSREMQEISAMKQRYEENDKKYEEIIKNLQQQINEMNKRNTEPSKKNNVQQDLIEFEEDYLTDMEIEYVPSIIVNRNNSIFDGSDNWYEIITYEVDEEGWKGLNDLVKEGSATKKYIDLQLEKLNITSREEAKKYNLSKKFLEVLEQEEKGDLKELFENSICYDGIIIKDIKDLDYKLIVQKQKKEGKNYYKIFSNRKIQDDRIIQGGGIHNYLLNRESAKTGIGILGFNQFLRTTKIDYKIYQDFLLFSIDRMLKLREIKASYKDVEELVRKEKLNAEDYTCQNIEKTMKREGKNFNNRVRIYFDLIRPLTGVNETDIPALFRIKEEDSYYVETYEQEGDKYGWNIRLGKSEELELIKLLEKLLSKEQKKEDIKDDELEIG